MKRGEVGLGIEETSPMSLYELLDRRVNGAGITAPGRLRRDFFGAQTPSPPPLDGLLQPAHQVSGEGVRHGRPSSVPLFGYFSLLPIQNSIRRG